MLLFALLACSNGSNPAFMGGGEPHAEGQSPDEEDYNPLGLGGDDTGTTDTTGGTGQDPDGPELVAGAAEWMDDDTVNFSIAYTDAQDDVVGGGLYWDLTTGGDLSGSYAIVDSTAYEDGVNCLAESDALKFAVNGADASVAWTLGVTAEDAAGNQSNRLVVDVAAGG